MRVKWSKSVDFAKGSFLDCMAGVANFLPNTSASLTLHLAEHDER
jgi:hypothetical protein